MSNQQLPPLGQASITDVRAMSEAERARLGYLVLVMRKWPQGFSWEALGLRLWLPDAGPSPELLKAYQRKADRLGGVRSALSGRTARQLEAGRVL